MRPRCLLALLSLLLAGGAASAGDLKDLFPGLIQQAVAARFAPVIEFDGNAPAVSGANPSMSGTFDASGPVASLTDQIASQFQRFPLGSTVAAFTFEFDPELNVFQRSTEGLGPLLSERAQTTGKGKLNFALSYSRIEFSVFEGDHLDNVGVDLGQGAPITILGGTGDGMTDFADGSTLGFTADVPVVGSRVDFTNGGAGAINGPNVAGTGPVDFVRGSLVFSNVQSRLDASLDVDTIAFFVNYGITDAIDVGLVVPLLNIDASGRVTTTGLLDPVTGTPVGPITTPTARDSSFGFGDIIARAKGRLLESEYADLAVRGDIVLPTGDENELRGFGDPAFGGTVIASKNFGLVSPHANAGLQFRTDDPKQHNFRWAVGLDVQPLDRLTFVLDAIGEHLINAGDQPVGENIYALATGLKVNPWRRLVISGNAVIRLNDEGLRADVIPSGTVEYTFF